MVMTEELLLLLCLISKLHNILAKMGQAPGYTGGSTGREQKKV